jgi:hypothetical protein
MAPPKHPAYAQVTNPHTWSLHDREAARAGLKQSLGPLAAGLIKRLIVECFESKSNQLLNPDGSNASSVSRFLNGSECPTLLWGRHYRPILKGELEKLARSSSDQCATANDLFELVDNLMRLWIDVSSRGGGPQTASDLAVFESAIQSSKRALGLGAVPATAERGVVLGELTATRQLGGRAGNLEPLDLDPSIAVLLWDRTPLHPPLNEERFRGYFNHAVVGEAIVLAYMRGEEGLDPSEVVCDFKPVVVAQPDYVSAKAGALDIQRSGDLVARRGCLLRCMSEAMDSGGRCFVSIGQASYQSLRAAQATVRERTDELIETGSGDAYLQGYPGLIYSDCVVLTADGKLLLGLRSVAANQDGGMWHVMGEGMEIEKDRNGTDCSQMLYRNALRGVKEELNLPQPLADVEKSCSFRLVAWTFALHFAAHPFVWIVRVNGDSKSILQQARSGQEQEHREFLAVDFDVNQCARIVLLAKVSPPTGLPTRVCDSGRLAVLLAMEHVFGRRETFKALERLTRIGELA